MNLIKNTLLLFAGILMLSGLAPETALAQRGGSRVITVYPDSQVYGGGQHPGTVRLKQMIRDQYPRLSSRLDQMKLQTVTVIGRSISRRYSNSNLTLEIGRQYQSQATLGPGRGSRRDITTLYARRGRQPQGNWKIHVKHRTQIQSLELELVPTRGNGGGGGGHHPRDLGQQIDKAKKVMNFKRDEDTFHARRPVRGDQITIQATRGHVNIHSVTVHLANGRSRELHGVTGRLKAGKGPRAVSIGYLRNSRRITAVTVKASTVEIQYPEPKLKVYVK